MTAKSPYSIPGIYKITNKISGKVYIGGTVNCCTRWSRHKWALRGGFHKLTELQQDWNNLGEQNFEFSIVIELPNLPINEFKILRTEAETKILNEFPLNYNRTIGAGDSGYMLSEATKKELSEINKKRWQDREYKNKLSETHKKKWANGEYKRTVSPETRKKQSIAKKKYYLKRKVSQLSPSETLL